jgi:hypothetical protein
MSDLKGLTLRQKFIKYKEPEFGSLEWLSIHSGLNKIHELSKSDEDIRLALNDLIFGSIRQYLNE